MEEDPFFVLDQGQGQNDDKAYEGLEDETFGMDVSEIVAAPQAEQEGFFGFGPAIDLEEEKRKFAHGKIFDKQENALKRESMNDRAQDFFGLEDEELEIEVPKPRTFLTDGIEIPKSLDKQKSFAHDDSFGKVIKSPKAPISMSIPNTPVAASSPKLAPLSSSPVWGSPIWAAVSANLNSPTGQKSVENQLANPILVPPSPQKITGMMSLEELESKLSSHQSSTPSSALQQPQKTYAQSLFQNSSQQATEHPIGKPGNLNQISNAIPSYSMNFPSLSGPQQQPQKQPFPQQFGGQNEDHAYHQTPPLNGAMGYQQHQQYPPTNQDPNQFNSISDDKFNDVIKHLYLSTASNPSINQVSNPTQTPGIVSNRRATWMENKKNMNADEIEHIIRIQEHQLKTSSPFLEDFYYQTLIRREEEGKGYFNITSEMPPKLPYHPPICDSTSKPIYHRKHDPFANVLGRIPVHSVRAPRTLLEFSLHKDDGDKGMEDEETENLQGKGWWPLFLAIESAYTCLVDIEDIDTIIRTAIRSRHTAHELLKKRQGIVEVFINGIGLKGSGMSDDDWELVVHDGHPLPSDSFFYRILQQTKGRKMVLRSLSALPPAETSILLSYITRNLALLLAGAEAARRAKREYLHWDALLAKLLDCLPNMLLSHHAEAIRSLLKRHDSRYLQAVMRTPEGAKLIYSIYQNAEFVQEQYAAHAAMEEHKRIWKLATSKLYQRLLGSFSVLVPRGNDDIANERGWKLLLAIALCANPDDRKAMGDEMRTFMRQISVITPTLSKLGDVVGVNLF